ncbi:MAG: hypothetical protein NVSMB64_07830 [Candidatus Velthaea sp.]
MLDFRKLADELPHMVWLAETDGTVVYFNRRWLEYTGLPFEEAITREGWAKTVEPGDLLLATAAFSAGVRGSAPFEFEMRLKSATAGEDAYRWHLIRNAPVFEVGVTVASWIGSATDIHDRKIISQDLRALSDAVPSMVFSAQPDGSLDFVNQRWIDYTGLTFAESLGMTWGPLVHPDDAPGTMEAWMRSVRERRQHEHTYRLRRAADGAFRWHTTRATPVLDAGGNITKWYGATTDVDAAKRTEQRMLLLLAGGAILARSLDATTVLNTVAEIAVKTVARTCFVDMLENGRLERVAYAGADSSGALTLEDARAFVPSLENDVHPIVRAARGMSVLTDMTSTHWKDLTAAAPEHSANRNRLDVRSAISVPLLSPAGIHGALTMILSSRDRHSFDSDDLTFAEELGRQAGAAVANAHLYEQERRVASRLQSASLPAVLPANDRLRFDAVYIPGNAEAEIGGDWYDALTLPDGRIVLSVGDVLGKGLEAAVKMGRIRQSLRTAAVLDPDPAAVLRAADVMLQLDDPDALATAVVAIVDTDAMTMRYASAGHPAPLIVDALGGVTDIPAEPGLPLGLRNGVRSAERELRLAVGDMVVLYTDGLTEATRDIDDGERRLKAALASSAVRSSATPAAAIKDAVLIDGSRDDVAILTFTVLS